MVAWKFVKSDTHIVDWFSDMNIATQIVIMKNVSGFLIDSCGGLKIYLMKKNYKIDQFVIKIKYHT